MKRNLMTSFDRFTNKLNRFDEEPIPLLDEMYNFTVEVKVGENLWQEVPFRVMILPGKFPTVFDCDNLRITGDKFIK